jgi:hypothetical protein
MIDEQLSQATMWRQGLKTTEASALEHTTHSSILLLLETGWRQMGQEDTWHFSQVAT